jgi:hypothetical protein
VGSPPRPPDPKMSTANEIESEDVSIFDELDPVLKCKSVIDCSSCASL